MTLLQSILSRFRSVSEVVRGAGDNELGTLPEWNLADLYPTMEDPAFAKDLAKAAADCKAFTEAYRGKLGTLAAENNGAGLAEAVKAYEALEELLGRIMSYAGLIYSGDTSNPANAKF
jgi:oligoendopeptidase F